MERYHNAVIAPLKEGACFRKENVICKIIKVNNVLQAIRFKVQIIKLETEGSISRYVQYVSPDYFNSFSKMYDIDFDDLVKRLDEIAKALSNPCEGCEYDGDQDESLCGDCAHLYGEW